MIKHKEIQKKILHLLPEGETRMEKRFPAIHRIADIAWLPQRIIFEVQCSPISLSEIKARKKDYASLGYTLVWILHDRRFNRKWPTIAELFARSGPCYFTNGNHFYDQVEIVKGRHRLYRGPPLSINLSAPLKKKNCLYFSGDAFDREAKPPEFSKPRNFYIRLLDALMSRYSEDSF